MKVASRPVRTTDLFEAVGTGSFVHEELYYVTLLLTRETDEGKIEDAFYLARPWKMLKVAFLLTCVSLTGLIFKK